MSYVSLYRKYRSQSFDDVVGQDHVTRTLQNAIKSDRIGHAYLFCGSRGTGKTTVARLLAKAVNCIEGPTPEPCNKCDACLSVMDGSAVDVIELDAASNRGIDDIKEIRDNVKYPPMRLRYKVFVIDEAHQLTDAAKDAFLKTLEEPPAHAIFILATTEAHEIPLTIRSRCQQFDFRRGSISDIGGRLRYVIEKEGREADDAAIDVIARNARGSWRDSLSLLEQVLSFTDENITVEHVNTVLGTVDEDVLFSVSDVIAREDAAAAFDLAERMVHEGKDVRELIKAIAGHFRDLLAASVGAGGNDTSLKATERARQFTRERLVAIIDIFTAAEKDLRFNEQHHLALELAFLKAIYPVVQTKQIVQPVQAASSAAPLRSEPVSTSAATPKPTPKPPVRITGAVETPSPATSMPEETLAPVSGNGEVTLARVKQAWPRVLRHIKEVQRKALLIGILREAEIVSLDGTVVCLGFDAKFSFHVQSVQQPANIDVISKAFEAVLGTRLTIRATVTQESQIDLLPPEEPLYEAPPPPSEDSDMVQDVLQMFGGKVVDDNKVQDLDDGNYSPWKET